PSGPEGETPSRREGSARLGQLKAPRPGATIAAARPMRPNLEHGELGMIRSTQAPDASTRLAAEATLARYLGPDFRGRDRRAAVLGLPLVLEFLLLPHAPEDGELAWDRFDPHAYVALIRDLEDTEAAFLKALLAEAIVFFDYLVDSGRVDPSRAAHVQAEIELALSALRG